MNAYRKWINQPSTSQPLHHLHGKNVLAIPELHSEVDGWRVYFLDGDTISMSVLGLWLSDGWIDRSLKDHEIREAVSSLTDIACKYHSAQQLRERIANFIVPYLRRIRQ